MGEGAGQPAFEFGRDGAMHEDALGRHAGRAVVQREAERERFDDEIEIGVGANDDGVAAAQFHRGGNEMRRELGENLFAGFGAAGEENFVRTRIDGGARGFGGFGQQRDELGVEAGANDEFMERTRGRGAADAGFEQHGIAGDERLNHLHAGQQQRVIARADDENDAERFAMNFTAHARRARAEVRVVPRRRGARMASGFAFEKATGFGERKNFGGERFERGTLAGGGGGFGKSSGVFGDQAAQLANEIQSRGERRGAQRA